MNQTVMPEFPPDSASDLAPAAESLYRIQVLLRLAGPLPEPEPGPDRIPWMAWLNSAEAAAEGQMIATTHRLALQGKFRELDAGVGRAPSPLPGPVSVSSLLPWLASARHPRALLRWCQDAMRAEIPPSAPQVVAVALAAFQFPRQEAFSGWFFLRWRAAWQKESWPAPGRFLLASGAVLPSLRRRVLRRTSAFSGNPGPDKSQAANL